MNDENVSQPKQDLVKQLTRMNKSFHLMKAAVSREAPEKAAYSLLFPLLDSNRRASELAEIVHSDPSTASRHVAHLVSNGLAERVADQQDGRATLVSITDKGREFCSAMRAQREAALATLLAEWSDDQAQQFSVLMSKFNDDIEANSNHMIQGISKAIDNATKVSEKETV